MAVLKKEISNDIVIVDKSIDAEKLLVVQNEIYMHYAMYKSYLVKVIS